MGWGRWLPDFAEGLLSEVLSQDMHASVINTHKRLEYLHRKVTYVESL